MNAEKLKGLTIATRRKNDNFDYGTFSTFLNRIGIYKITNKITGICYIGSSTDIGRRLQKHFSELRMKRHTNKRLQEDFNKYGMDIFEWSIVEETNSDIITKERDYQIQIGIDNLYNDKISNYYMSDELRKKYGSSDKSTHKTQEYRDKMSLLKSHGIAQYDRHGNLIFVYDNMNDVLKHNPTFKGQPIRGVCNGSKKTAYNYVWRYINNDGTIKDIKE